MTTLSFKGFLCVALCALLGTTGCASIIGKSQSPVTITSHPDQADISVVDERGETIFTGKTPTTVTLRKKAGYFRGKHYSVTFQKEGYAKQVAEIRRGVSGWYVFGNFVFGGLIGWLVVDPATGAMWTLQKEVSVELTQQSAAVDDGLRIVLVDDLPLALRSHLIRVRCGCRGNEHLIEQEVLWSHRHCDRPPPSLALLGSHFWWALSSIW